MVGYNFADVIDAIEPEEMTGEWRYATGLR
jgi:hypothetical protein